MRVWDALGWAGACGALLGVSCGGRSTTIDTADASMGGSGAYGAGGSGAYGTGGSGAYGAGGSGAYGAGGSGAYGTGGSGAYGAGGSGAYGAGGSGAYGTGGTGGGYGSGGGPASCNGAICGPPLVCINGQCRCPPPLDYCAKSCVDLSTDPSNCGGCNVTCATSCVNGKCQQGTCDPAFCPSMPFGAPCCLPQDACGVDYGMGCVPPNTDGGP